jgi:ribosome-associated protein
MPEPLAVARGVLVPASAQEVRAVRSSGPGGQNVNKVASKIELHVDLGQVVGLGPEARSRLARLAARRLDAVGRLLVTSQRFRDQPRNLEDAREKVRALLALALVRPKPRRPTRATAASKRRRLDQKKRRAATKRVRGRVAVDD